MHINQQPFIIDFGYCLPSNLSYTNQHTYPSEKSSMKTWTILSTAPKPAPFACKLDISNITFIAEAQYNFSNFFFV